jgi:hypothetical protein
VEGQHRRFILAHQVADLTEPGLNGDDFVDGSSGVSSPTVASARRYAAIASAWRTPAAHVAAAASASARGRRRRGVCSARARHLMSSRAVYSRSNAAPAARCNLRRRGVFRSSYSTS